MRLTQSAPANRVEDERGSGGRWRKFRVAMRRTHPWGLLGVIGIAAAVAYCYQVVLFAIMQEAHTDVALKFRIAATSLGFLALAHLLACIGIWILLIAIIALQQRFNPTIAPWLWAISIGVGSSGLFSLLAECIAPGIWSYQPHLVFGASLTICLLYASHRNPAWAGSLEA